MKFSVEVDFDTRSICNIVIVSDDELLLVISRNILSKIEKRPGNTWYGGYYINQERLFEPLPDLDLIKFLEYVSQARDECIEDDEFHKNSDKLYIKSEINRLTQQLELLEK